MVAHLHGRCLTCFFCATSRRRPVLLSKTQTLCSAVWRQSFCEGVGRAVQLTQTTSATAVDERKQLNGTSSLAPGQCSTSLTFQEAIVRLQEYWSSVGCALWQSHNTEVGAGTMNPATFLRVIGPEEWRVCYLEPSVRPDDSRYGENPNRLQQHTQMQVILKPDPGNPQELYLGSLSAIGIDTRKHDIRFVEDNWENPALGAWGLGWEVWMDGQEITQFTYFQQAGGQSLEIPSVEITYGLERIITVLQDVTHFKDILYNRRSRYGEMLMQNEYEMSCFNLEQADIGIYHQLYGLYEKEAGNLIKKGLPIPAYQHLLKLSHCFNVLDARGAIGVTQRAKCFATMRCIAKQVAELWLQKRAELGHPLGMATPILPAKAGKVKDAMSSDTADMLLELGCEELPPADIRTACQQLRDKIPKFLQRLRIEHGEVLVDSTPRRLVVQVANVAGRQPNLSERLRGPPANVAFGKDGAPTKALLGFCKKNSIAEESIAVEADSKGVEYVWAVRHQEGLAAAVVLTEELGPLIEELSFQRAMRWNSATSFSRPVRWLVGLHGSTLLPFAFAGLQASRESRGLRNTDNFSVSTLQDYLIKLKQQNIVSHRPSRSDIIWERAQAAARGEGGIIPESCQDDLLKEVTDLVEAPTIILGRFDPAFLKLPEEVLILVMRKHQRYFPITDADSRLVPAFVAVANGPIDPDVVRAGNEAVLQARFQDALFFYNTDMQQNLADFKPALANITFQRNLGTMLDKSQRIEMLIPGLAKLAGLQDAAHEAAAAAALAKADLATSMVMEMTALAGIMGRHYAQQQGIEAGVAQAIFECVLPRQAGDAVPSTSAGLLCSVADRLDSLVGLFAVGHAPSATTDIYGLRRAAYGMLETLLTRGSHLNLRRAIDLAAELQPVPVSSNSKNAVFEFVTRRLEQLIVDSGIMVEIARAILNERPEDPLLAHTSAKDLQREFDQRAHSPLHTVATALSRPVRLVRGKTEQCNVDESLFKGKEEKELFATTAAIAAEIQPDMGISDFLQAAMKLEGPINEYFDKVFVMCEDSELRNNRIALLQQVARIPKGIIDLTSLPGY